MSSEEKENVLNRLKNHLLSPSPPKAKVASLLSLNINVALFFFFFWFLCRGTSLSQLQVCENFLWLQTAVVSRIRKTGWNLSYSYDGKYQRQCSHGLVKTLLCSESEREVVQVRISKDPARSSLRLVCSKIILSQVKIILSSVC